MNDLPTAPRDSSPVGTVVRGVYDLQALRLQAGGRIIAQFKAKLGQAPSKPETELEEEEQEVLDLLRQDFRRLTDGVAAMVKEEAGREIKVGEIDPVAKVRADFKAKAPKKLKFPGREEFADRRSAADIAVPGTPLITSYVELCLVRQYIELERQEAAQFRLLGEILLEDPIYAGYLQHIVGIGPAMAGILLAEIDLNKARSASSLWAYAGYDVAKDGRGRSRRKEHLTEYTYTPKGGGPEKTRVGITFNPTLKTKMFVLATCLLRSKNARYTDIYECYKHRMESHAIYGAQNDGQKSINLETGVEEFVTSKARRHRMAIRYMIKQFLADYWEQGRLILGLPIRRPYHEAKLGLAPHGWKPHDAPDGKPQGVRDPNAIEPAPRREQVDPDTEMRRVMKAAGEEEVA